MTQEESALWDVYTQTRNVLDRNRLVEHYMPWAKKYISFYARNGRGLSWARADLIGAAMLGLIQAVERFDPQSDAAEFRSYASLRVYGAAIDAVRNLDVVAKSQRWIAKADGKEQATTFSLDAVPSAGRCNRSGSDDRDFDFHETPKRLGVDEAGYSRVDSLFDLEVVLATLTEKKRWVAEQHWILGRTQADIGRDIGCTPENVSMMLTAAMREMRESFGSKAKSVGKGRRRPVRRKDTKEIYPSVAAAERQMGKIHGSLHKAIAFNRVCDGTQWEYVR